MQIKRYRRIERQKNGQTNRPTTDTNQKAGRQTDGQTELQTDQQAGTQTEQQTDHQAGRQADLHRRIKMH